MSGGVAIRNAYTALPKRYLERSQKYKNYKHVGIDLPARILVIGSSGSGKTNWLISMIRIFGCFRRIYLFAKCLDEPLYRMLIDYFARLEKKLKTEILFYSNDITEIPTASSMAADGDPVLVILDDLINAQNLMKSNVPDLFTMGRKSGITTILLSQSYFKVPQLLRQNSSFIVLKKVASSRDLVRICSEYSLGIDSKELIRMYKSCVKGIEDFMIISPNDYEGKQFRCGFKPIRVPDQLET
jgi:hypothetical protein